MFIFPVLELFDKFILCRVWSLLDIMFLLVCTICNIEWHHYKHSFAKISMTILFIALWQEIKCKYFTIHLEEVLISITFKTSKRTPIQKTISTRTIFWNRRNYFLQSFFLISSDIQKLQVLLVMASIIDETHVQGAIRKFLSTVVGCDCTTWCASVWFRNM